MPMVLTEEQEMLRDAAKGYLADNAPVSQLRRLRDEENPDSFDRDTWKAMAEMGWTGVLVPEDQGGVEMGFTAAGLIAEEMGRNLTASPWLSSAVIGTTALTKFGSDSQKSDWLGRIAAGDAILALALDEGRKHDPAEVAVTAERSGNGFKLNGTKSFVADGSTADAYIVSARTDGASDDENGITLFLVPADSNGLSRDKQPMIDSRDSASIRFENVELTADSVLGDVDGGAKALTVILDAGRAVLAAEMSGAAQECLDRTVAYIKERKQFGEIIGTFQGLQHRASHLYSEIELGKSIVLKALDMMDQSPEMAGLMVSAAKAKLGEVAQLAAQEAVQMHGGMGMTDEFDIGFFMKRIRVAEALYGDSKFHAERFARIRGF